MLLIGIKGINNNQIINLFNH